MAGRKAANKQAGNTAELELESTEAQEASVPSYHREHPDKLTGDALRELAHRQGLAKSSLPSMTDEQIRMQLRYLTYRRMEEDAVG